MERSRRPAALRSTFSTIRWPEALCRSLILVLRRMRGAKTARSECRRAASSNGPALAYAISLSTYSCTASMSISRARSGSACKSIPSSLTLITPQTVATSSSAQQNKGPVFAISFMRSINSSGTALIRLRSCFSSRSSHGSLAFALDQPTPSSQFHRDGPKASWRAQSWVALARVCAGV